MARMLGRVSQPWCPACNAPPGLDCPDVSRSPRQVRVAERRQTRAEILDELVQEAAEYNLYELTAEPRPTR